MVNADSKKNWFESGGKDYAQFRPEYPSQLAAYLASITPDNECSVDVGCGNGQLTQCLALYFKEVVGVDPSVDQIGNAIPHENISYQCATAEKLPIADHSASLITAAQAAHWFNLPGFYKEVRRIAVPRGVLALISYGVPKLDAGLNERFQKFYWDEIAPFWPPERKLVDAGYQGIDFPFKELSAPSLEIQMQWALHDFIGYLNTWSAVRSAREAGREDLLTRFTNDIVEMWGDNTQCRQITWSIAMRIGRL